MFQENLHFYLSEMLICAIEKAAWEKELEVLEKNGESLGVSF